jgi:uncharacterized protein YceH (UPF0502 family)
VEGFLEELAAKPVPLAIKLNRAPGEREARWAHLLCGEVAQPAGSVARSAADDLAAAGVGAGELSALRAEQTRLAAEVADLKALLQRLARELGVE